MFNAWTVPYDITSLTNAPAPSTWADVVNLQCDVQHVNNGGASFAAYVGEVEVIVTYELGSSSSSSSSVSSSSSSAI